MVLRVKTFMCSSENQSTKRREACKFANIRLVFVTPNAAMLSPLIVRHAD